MSGASDLAHVVVDWGTSSFRLWGLGATGEILAERRSGEGLLSAGETGFESVLEAHLAAIGAADDTPVMMCGMVGSRTGWVEAPYLDAPVRLNRLADCATEVPSARRRIRILPGVAQRSDAAPDVMRGEETQLLRLTLDERRSGLVCMPGTHSKWVSLVDGELQSFATFMTGELFQLVRTQSVVAGAVEGAGTVDPANPAFAAGVRAGFETPAVVTNALFALRAAWLVARAGPDDMQARLSGLLIGVEFAGAAARYGDLSAVALVASGPAAGLYGAALAAAGVRGVELFDAEACVRDGLHAAAAAAFPRHGDIAR